MLSIGVVILPYPPLKYVQRNAATSASLQRNEPQKCIHYTEVLFVVHANDVP